jgi:hypothetical protein
MRKLYRAKVIEDCYYDFDSNNEPIYEWRKGDRLTGQYIAPDVLVGAILDISDEGVQFDWWAKIDPETLELIKED